MLLFWLIVVVMMVVTLALILPALLKPNRLSDVNALDEKRVIFRQQFEEIDQDKESGFLDVNQYTLAKTELERRMLEELGGHDAPQVLSHKPDRRLAWLLLLFIPLIAVLIYLKIGNPSAINAPSTNADLIAKKALAGEMAPLLAAMQDKLTKNPNDGEGWALLARTYTALERMPEAVNAYEHASNIIHNNAQLLADYADTLAVANGYALAGKPTQLAEQALKIDAHNIKALMLAAAAATDRKDYSQAIAYWQSLKQALPADSLISPKIQAALDELYRVSAIKAPVKN